MNHQQIFIFTGPTITPEAARSHLNASYLPPVKLGDIYRISELFSPRIIGIIDGYFNQVPAIWHKEILHAMSEGIVVYGAASMGALRAAELDSLGMIGCGQIYRAYESGVLPPFIDEAFEDDDEVAVIHGPAELAYPAASDAMVNIRFTLAKAWQQGVIDERTCKLLAGFAKELFYAERNYAAMLSIANQQGVPQTQLDALREWITVHSVDQKKRDAISLLEQIQSSSHNTSSPTPPETRPFQHTSQWQSAIDEIDQSHYVESPALNELRLQGPEYFQALDRALQSRLGQKAQQPKTDQLDLTRLHNQPEELNALYSDYWQRRAPESDLSSLSAMQKNRVLLAYLHQSEALDALEARAADKISKLEQLTQKPDSIGLSDLDRLQLCDWHFSRGLGLEMPQQIPAYIEKLGLKNDDSFYDMLLGEYLYLSSEN